MITQSQLDSQMEYLQFPTNPKHHGCSMSIRPLNATGVSIELSVVDANGNYRNIGTATSDADGFFNYNWKPDIEGAYTLYASFAGSKAYWPSHAVTSFAVDPAAATSTSQPEIILPPTEMYIGAAAAAIIIAIAIGFTVTI